MKSFCLRLRQQQQAQPNIPQTDTKSTGSSGKTTTTEDREKPSAALLSFQSSVMSLCRRIFMSVTSAFFLPVGSAHTGEDQQHKPSQWRCGKCTRVVYQLAGLANPAQG